MLRQMGALHKVLRYWGHRVLAGDRQPPPQLRGRVDLYDGARHLFQCLIVAVAQEGDEMIFDFKASKRACKGQLRWDFERAGMHRGVDCRRRTSLILNWQVFWNASRKRSQASSTAGARVWRC